MKEQVLKAMREFGAPVNAGKIAEITGLDRKEVDKAFAELKKEGAIVSRIRCKWEPAKQAEDGNQSSQIQERRFLLPAFRLWR